jgi:hypothetical protein
MADEEVRLWAHLMTTDTARLGAKGKLSEEIVSHPGMISLQERRLLYGLAKDRYRGQGIIIDGGAFLGASAIAFAHGLRDNGAISLASIPAPPIHVFERAIAGANLERHAAKSGLPPIPKGESFEPLLRDLLKPVSDLLQFHIGDILRYDGNDLDGIEICFLDILKTPLVALHAMRLFFPQLLPGAFIVQQDYFFSDLPFVKVLNEALSNKLRYLGEVRSTALFQVIEPISPAEVEEANAALRSLERAVILHKLAEARTISPARQYMMRLSRSLLYASFNDVDMATATVKEANRQFADIAFDAGGKFRDNMAWRVDRVRSAIECG